MHVRARFPTDSGTDRAVGCRVRFWAGGKVRAAAAMGGGGATRPP